jgi:L-ascorbate metabolism protein UlaG (beta-lactamase superfamily)
MIQPVLKDEAFLRDVKDATHQPGFRLWWLGQSGFLLQWEKRHLLFDPYLSDSLTKKYDHTDKPHVRMTERVVAPERLEFIDVVTSSHNHTDHLDAETLQPLLKASAGTRMVIPDANRTFVAERLGVRPDWPVGLDAGEYAEVCGFRVTAVPAAHELVEKDKQGRCIYLGYIVEFGPWCVYHSGDTVPYPGMVEGLKQWRIDVMLLPINGRLPARRVAGNLWGREAVALADECEARLVIPCHYEMFEFNTESPDEFVQTATHVGQNYRVLRCGERWSSDELPSRAAAAHKTSG